MEELIEHPITHNIGLGSVNINDPRVKNREMRWHVLFDIIEKEKYENIVEVGSQEGRTPWYILKNSTRESVNVSIVDPYLYYDGYGYKEPFSMTDVEKQARKYLNEFVESNRCHFYKDYSINTAKEFKDESLDLVFIDANHTYKYVKEDIESWYPKIKKGGMLAGHDWCDGFPGVEQAAKEYFQPLNKDIKLAHNTVWLVKK